MNADPKMFPVAGRGVATPPVTHERAVRAMSDAELEDEILGGRGDDAYRLVVVTEYERRAAEGKPVPS